jgi:hypothetical protein
LQVTQHSLATQPGPFGYPYEVFLNMNLWTETETWRNFGRWSLDVATVTKCVELYNLVKSLLHSDLLDYVFGYLEGESYSVKGRK